MYAQPKSYLDLKSEQLKKISTITILAIPIDFPSSPSSPKDKRFIPFEVGCLCENNSVQDSPDNPCYCSKRPPIIIWIPPHKISANYKSDKTNHDGRELTVLEIERDSTIYVERLQEINLSQISNRNNFKVNGTGGRTPPNITSTSTALIWELIEAFHLGVSIGEHLDEAFGISDWLAGVNNKPHTVKVP